MSSIHKAIVFICVSLTLLLLWINTAYSNPVPPGPLYEKPVLGVIYTSYGYGYVHGFDTVDECEKRLDDVALAFGAGGFGTDGYCITVEFTIKGGDV